MFCPACRKHFPDEVRFCPECGTPTVKSPPKPFKRVIVTSTETVPGREIEEVLGVVYGNIVRAKNVLKDFVAEIKMFFGGEVHEYTELFSESRAIAVERMIGEALKLGADAVINLRFMSSTIAGGVSELLAYGTAVKLKKERTHEEY